MAPSRKTPAREPLPPRSKAVSPCPVLCQYLSKLAKRPRPTIANYSYSPAKTPCRRSPVMVQPPPILPLPQLIGVAPINLRSGSTTNNVCGAAVVAPSPESVCTAFLPVNMNSLRLLAAASLPASTNTGTTLDMVRPLLSVVAKAPVPASFLRVPSDRATTARCTPSDGHQSHPPSTLGAPVMTVELYLAAPPSLRKAPPS